jgi:hypothetical protein
VPAPSLHSEYDGSSLLGRLGTLPFLDGSTAPQGITRTHSAVLVFNVPRLVGHSKPKDYFVCRMSPDLKNIPICKALFSPSKYFIGYKILGKVMHCDFPIPTGDSVETAQYGGCKFHMYIRGLVTFPPLNTSVECPTLDKAFSLRRQVLPSLGASIE